MNNVAKGVAIVAVAGAFVVSLVLVPVVRSVVVHARFKSLIADHPPGSSARALAAASFVASADRIAVTDGASGRVVGFVDPRAAFAPSADEIEATSAAARSAAGTLVDGTVVLGWTGLPPFERLSLEVLVRRGAIATVSSHQLD